MAIEVNGVTLPDIPSEVLEQYPYATLVCADNGTGVLYLLMAAASQFYVIRDYYGAGIDMLGALNLEDGTILGGTAITCTGETYEISDTWEPVDGYSDSCANMLGYMEQNGATFYIGWSNHDVYVVTSDNVLTDEIYFARNDVSYDEKYIVKSAFIIAMADKAREVSSTTEKLTTDKIQAAFDTLHSADGVEFG